MIVGGRIHLNKITFLDLEEGVYSLHIGHQIVDDNIIVNEGVNVHDLLLDDRFDGIRVTIINNTGQDFHTLHIGGAGLEKDFLFPKPAQINYLDRPLLHGDSHDIILPRYPPHLTTLSIRYHSDINIFTKYELSFGEDSIMVFSEDDLDSFSYIRTYFQRHTFDELDKHIRFIVPWHNEQGQIQIGIPSVDSLMSYYDIVGLFPSYVHDACACMGWNSRLGGAYRRMLDLEVRDITRLHEVKTRLNNESTIVWAYLISEYERGE
jgi:hypothetical protein